MDTDICAPHRADTKHGTCFSMEQLIELCKAYNRYCSKQKLNPNSNRLQKSNTNLIKIKNDKAYLLSQIKEKFDDVCSGDEVCITKQSFMNEIVKEMRPEFEKSTFRPNGPTKSSEWLSTSDINNIMMQYENVYPDFSFLGAVPMDCDELFYCSLHKINFDKFLSEGKKQLGIIFNLDRSHQPGSHWVSMYINIENGEIYFCDSGGKPPTDNILGMINDFRKYYLKKTGKNANYQFNSQPYQKDSSECGIYSSNFIIRKLAGESFENIVNNPLKFKEINSCRNVYFKNKPSKFEPNKYCDPVEINR